MNLIDCIDFSLCEGGYIPRLTGWHIFSDEEHKLALKADNSLADKKKYVDFYKNANEEYYYNGLKNIENIFHRFNRTWEVSENNPIVIDMIYSLHRFGCTYEEYFWYDFPNLNFDGRNQFITDKVRYYLYNKLNLEENNVVFRNKLLTFNKYNKYYGRRMVEIKSDGDFCVFLDFCKNIDAFILKKVDGDCGRGSKLYRNIETNLNSLRELFYEIRSVGDVVIEEIIEQSEALAQFHPQSVNTVRMMTIMCKDGIHIFHPFFRMGRGDSFVDNGGAGGIFTAIDVETGICYTPGTDENANQYIIHPDTGKQIIGYRIPRWDEAKELVKRMAQQTTNRYVGWDLALTDRGWVLVEGNNCGQFIMQIADKKGRLQELLELISFV